MSVTEMPQPITEGPQSLKCHRCGTLPMSAKNTDTAYIRIYCTQCQESGPACGYMHHAVLEWNSQQNRAAGTESANLVSRHELLHRATRLYQVEFPQNPMNIAMAQLLGEVFGRDMDSMHEQIDSGARALSSERELKDRVAISTALDELHEAGKLVLTMHDKELMDEASTAISVALTALQTIQETQEERK